MSRTDTPYAAPGTVRPALLATVLSRAAELLDRGPALGRDADLVQLVEVDALLRGAVYRIVRCPVYAASAQELSLGAALDRLDPQVIADAIRSLAPGGGHAERHVIEARCRTWLHGVAVAAAARWLSNQGEHDRPDEAYTAGLAHALCHGETETGAREILRDLRFGERVEQVAYLGADCGRPDRAIQPQTEALRATPALRSLATVLARADRLVNDLGFGTNGAPAAHGSEEGDAAAVAEAVELELVHAAGLLGLPPLPWDDLVRQMTEREERMLLDIPESEHRLAPVATGIERLADAQQEILALRSLPSIHEILDRGVGLLHAGLSFDRIVVLEREHGNPSAARVRAVACRTRLPGVGVRGLVEVPIALDGSLAAALESDRALRSTRADAAALRILGTDSFAVAPLRAGSGSVGLIVGDFFLRGVFPPPEAASSLGLAAVTLGLVLENAALHAEGKTLRALAERDSLTGINNRRNVMEILQREIDRARRYGKPLAVAMIDVDHFKSWNDLHGHQVGDMVLQTVAQIISSCSREMDACGRYGGEEFLVVLPETPAEHATLYAERLRQAIEAHGADLAELYRPSSLSVSIGVTQLLPRGDDDRQMIHRADTALYAAKEHGRNRVCVEPGQSPLRPVPAPPRTRSVLDEV